MHKALVLARNLGDQGLVAAALNELNKRLSNLKAWVDEGAFVMAFEDGCRMSLHEAVQFVNVLRPASESAVS